MSKGHKDKKGHVSDSYSRRRNRESIKRESLKY